MKNINEYLRRSLLTGILIVVPVIGSAWLLIIFVGWIDSMALQVWSFFGIPSSWNPNQYLPFELPVFGLLTAAVALIFVGAIARVYFVNYFISLGERLIHKIPLLSSLYKGIKQFMNTLFANRRDRFNKVVLVEFPKEVSILLDLSRVLRKVNYRKRPRKKFIMFLCRHVLIPHPVFS